MMSNRSALLAVFVVSFVFLSTNSEAQQGRVLEGRTFQSDTLDREWIYTIYLPPDYDSSERAYPVYYLLHGLGGNHASWVRAGNANTVADTLIESGEVPPAILVWPDGAVRSMWLDSDPETGFGAIETALLEDLIPHIDQEYRTIATRNARMISGFSMGGYGALRMAFRNPEMFGAVSGLSPAMWRTFPQGPPVGDEPPSPAFGVPFDPAKWEAETPFAYVDSLAAKSETNRMHVLLLTGDHDPFHQITEATTDLFLVLRAADIPAELRIVDGGHTFDVWSQGLRESMSFFGDVYQRRRR
jgi:enterochelin esterase family protein